MNIFLLLKVKETILKHRIDMDRWDCCIAGWVCRLSGVDLSQAGSCEIERMARYFLKVSENQAVRLFYRSLWPADLGGERNAECAAKRIDRFIETNGEG